MLTVQIEKNMINRLEKAKLCYSGLHRNELENEGTHAI